MLASRYYYTKLFKKYSGQIGEAYNGELSLQKQKGKRSSTRQAQMR